LQLTSLALTTTGRIAALRSDHGYGKLTTFAELLGKRTLIFNGRRNLRRFARQRSETTNRRLIF
jgi:hypothetical protein